MTQRNCLLTGAPLTPDNDSLAHIIPSAIGGRLKPGGLLSREANAVLNDKVDLPLIKCLQPIMSLLGGSRDRGVNPTIRMTDALGKEYDLKHGAPITPARPEYTETPTARGLEVDIRVRTMKELRVQLGRFKKQYPNFDVEAALKHARVVEHGAGVLHAQWRLDPNVFFPAAFAATSLFAASRSQGIHPRFAPYLLSIDETADRGTIAMPPDTFYWFTERPWFRTDAEVAHVIAFVGSHERGQALCCIDYFGVCSVATLLPYSAEAGTSFVYGVDVLKGENANVNLIPEAFDHQPWEATHTIGQASLYLEVQRRMSNVVDIIQRRDQHEVVGQMVDGVLGDDHNRLIDEDDVRKLMEGVDVIAKRILDT